MRSQQAQGGPCAIEAAKAGGVDSPIAADRARSKLRGLEALIRRSLGVLTYITVEIRADIPGYRTAKVTINTVTQTRQSDEEQLHETKALYVKVAGVKPQAICP